MGQRRLQKYFRKLFVIFFFIGGNFKLKNKLEWYFGLKNKWSGRHKYLRNPMCTNWQCLLLLR